MFVQYNMLWGKLFPISLFENIQFPVWDNMQYFEDGATTFKLIYEAGKVRRTSEKLYYTVGKVDSMTRQPITEKRIEDSIISSESPVTYYKEKADYYLERCAYVQYLQTIISILEICETDSSAVIDRKKYKRYGWQLYKKYYIKAMGGPKLSIKKKIQYTIIRISPALYFWMKRKILKR